MSQTTVQNAAAIRKGSLRIQIGDDFGSLVDIGAIRKPKVTLLTEPQSIEFDNVDDLRQFAEGDKLNVSFDLCEINLTNLKQFDDGLVVYSTVAGAPTPVVDEAHTMSADVGVALTYKNGDDSRVASIVVTTDIGGAQVEGTNYEVYVNEDGYTCIVKIGAGSQAILVDYSYTPNASKKITLNKIGTKVLKCVRITNEDGNGAILKIDIENATNVSAPAITFAGDDEAEIASVPITLEGYLVEITDEQQIV